MDAVLRFHLRNQAFQGWLYSYKMVVSDDHPTKDLRLFYQENKNKPTIIQVIEEEAAELGPVKVNFTLEIHLAKAVLEGIETVDHYFRLPDPLIVTHLNQPEVVRQTNAVVNSIIPNSEILPKFLRTDPNVRFVHFS